MYHDRATRIGVDLRTNWSTYCVLDFVTSCRASVLLVLPVTSSLVGRDIPRDRRGRAPVGLPAGLPSAWQWPQSPSDCRHSRVYRVPRVVTLEPCQPGRRRAAFGRFGVGGCRIPTGRCWGPLHARGFEQPCSVAAITALRFSNSHNILAVTSASVGPGHRAARVASQLTVLCGLRVTGPPVSVSRCASG